MQFKRSSVHQTEIHRIQNAREGGWEFVCHSCGYRARYTIDREGTQKLEILFVGDSSARHTTGMAPENEMDGQGYGEIYDPVCPLPEVGGYDPADSDQTPPDDVGMGQEGFLARDDWLPPRLQEQVEAILRKCER